jgi:hypothetical protein
MNFFENASKHDLMESPRFGGDEGTGPRFPHRGFWYQITRGRVPFVPLLNLAQDHACQLDITWFRRERAGDIVQSGGDLDNRLKNLLDGLSVPRNDNQVPKNAAPERCYCLLEDDSMITKLAITTFQTLEPVVSGEETHVDLLIRVTPQSTWPMWGNRDFA